MTRSTIALLGTLRELHTTIPGYSLRHLRELVASKQPDLLCVEIDRNDWEANDLHRAPFESSEALAGLSRSSEITLVPIGAGGRQWSDSGVPAPCRGAMASVRRRIGRLLDRMTVGLMRIAGGARAINSPLVGLFCSLLCHFQVLLADPEDRHAWQAKNEELLDGILNIARRDPDRRVLVAVDCRRKHWLRRQLRQVPEVTLVDFWKF